MKPSLEMRVFLKHLPSEYRHAARVAYWIGANDATKAFRGIFAKTFANHEAHHPEAGTPHKSGRVERESCKGSKAIVRWGKRKGRVQK